MSTPYEMQSFSREREGDGAQGDQALEGVEVNGDNLRIFG
jgi:hypothetical protein